jgi:hypothetical protein
MPLGSLPTLGDTLRRRELGALGDFVLDSGLPAVR